MLRLEYFADPQGIRSSETVPAGKNVDLWEMTATAEYKIWRGLVGRLEFRHDEANRRAFSLHGNPPAAGFFSRPGQGAHFERHQRRAATTAQIASTTPKGHAPCRKP